MQAARRSLAAHDEASRSLDDDIATAYEEGDGPRVLKLRQEQEAANVCRRPLLIAVADAEVRQWTEILAARPNDDAAARRIDAINGEIATLSLEQKELQARVARARSARREARQELAAAEARRRELAAPRSRPAEAVL